MQIILGNKSRKAHLPDNCALQSQKKKKKKKINQYLNENRKGNRDYD